MNLIRVIVVFFILIPVLASNSYAINNNTKILINDAITGEHRAKENKARDIHRRPDKTLSFFGIQSNMTVLEILPGRRLVYGNTCTYIEE